MTFSKSLSNNLILTCAIVGIIVATVLTFEHYKPSADIGCMAVGGDCRATIESDFGHLGPIPTSIFGLGLYVTILGIAVRRRKLIAQSAVELHDHNSDVNSEDSELGPTEMVSPFCTDQRDRYIGSNDKVIRNMNLLLWFIAAPAFGISIWLQKVSIYDLFSFCPWCMTSAFLVTIIFVCASKDLFLSERKLVGEQKLLAGTVAFIGAMFLLMGAPDVIAQIGRIRANIIKIPPPVVITQKPGTPNIVVKGMNVTGPATAPYTIVEFADYQCPHCQKASFTIKKEMQDNPTKYRLAFRNFPLQNHNWANAAALAAEAAGIQGKFWEMHDFIYAHQADMDKKDFAQSKFIEWATAIGLDTKKFEADVQSDKLREKVATDAYSAPQLGVKMTPTFFIIGINKKTTMLSGLEQLKAAMDDPNNPVWQ